MTIQKYLSKCQIINNLQHVYKQSSYNKLQENTTIYNLLANLAKIEPLKFEQLKKLS